MNLSTNRPTIWALVLYLSFAMLTGCTTLELEILDPTEPVKIAMPLVNSLNLNVAMEYGNGSVRLENGRDRTFIGSMFTTDFLNAMKQRLISSGATLNVQPSEKCEHESHERTLCITATIFNYKWSFFKWVKEFAVTTVYALALFVPLFFSSHEKRDWVIAETLLLDRTGKEIARFKVQSEFIATVGRIRSSDSRTFYSENNKELANRIVLELKRHPHWFEPAPNQSP